MSERDHLVDDYLRVNNRVRNTGFHSISADECDKMFRNLVAFERPDMYAELDDKIIILEHFEFDASRFTRKGMKGKAEEAHLEKRLKAVPMDGTIHIDAPRYDISLHDWQLNFERSFQEHYERIDIYKKRVAEATGNNGKPILVGFFIEHQFSPLVNIHNDIAELSYCMTVQFAEKIHNSPNLDFVLFCGHLDGRPQITYRDRNALTELSDRLVDLQDENVSLSHLNHNEVVMYHGFEITREDLDNA